MTLESGDARQVLVAEPSAEPEPSSHAPQEGHGDGASELAAFEAAKAQVQLGFASRSQGVLVICNTMLGGSGLLGIPHAFSGSGFLLGSLLIITFGCLSAFGCHLLHCAVRRIGIAPATFSTAISAVAPRWNWVINMAVVVKCFGVATSYLIIAGDLAPSALVHFGLAEVQRWEAVLAAFAVSGALSFLKNLSALRPTSFLSMLIVVWTTLLLGLFFVGSGPTFEPCGSLGDLARAVTDDRMKDRPCNGAGFEPVVGQGALTLAKTIPVFIFAFTCQQNIFPVCNEVRNASRLRINQVILVAYAVAGMVYWSAAMLGYATYGDAVLSNVLAGYPVNSVVEATRLFFSCLAVFSFPMQLHPARSAALALCTAWGAGPATNARFELVTWLLLGAALAVALKVSDLGIVLGVVGATGSTLVTYVLPGIIYMKAFPKNHLKWGLAACQFAAGLLIMPTCLFVVLAL